jgi:hypothetical protein
MRTDAVLDHQTLARIVAMIGLLGSSNDGEVIAAARAIQRALASAGCNFADLKKALAQPKPRPRVPDNETFWWVR